MEKTIEELKQIVSQFRQKISVIPEAEFSAKPVPNKWSKKEVLGHLTDSAQNNLRRFICGQYESKPSKIIYEQDFWVNANSYQEKKSGEVIELWRLLNEQICSVLRTMPTANYNRSCDTGHDREQLHTLEWLAEDYVRHLKHHLNQIIPGSYDVVYK
jgi:hypothetical protein